MKSPKAPIRIRIIPVKRFVPDPPLVRRFVHQQMVVTADPQRWGGAMVSPKRVVERPDAVPRPPSRAQHAAGFGCHGTKVPNVFKQGGGRDQVEGPIFKRHLFNGRLPKFDAGAEGAFKPTAGLSPDVRMAHEVDPHHVFHPAPEPEGHILSGG